MKVLTQINSIINKNSHKSKEGELGKYYVTESNWWHCLDYCIKIIVLCCTRNIVGRKMQ